MHEGAPELMVLLAYFNENTENIFLKVCKTSVLS
jgi:hypothetical protein